MGVIGNKIKILTKVFIKFIDLNNLKKKGFKLTTILNE